MSLERRAFYIDGFNLYFGLKDKGWRKYYWLNLQELCLRLTPNHQQLVKVRYFTARISGPNNDKRLRQKTYLQALETLPLVEIHYGHYLAHPQKCLKCGHTFTRFSEKKSDVNLAVAMLTDALDDLYDIAVVISADSDLVPAIDAIRKHAPNKRIGLLSPPERGSAALKNCCHFYVGSLGEAVIRKSQFSDNVTSKTGYPLTRPGHWT